jgi:membrane-bound lytic murein transglycosylase D
MNPQYMGDRVPPGPSASEKTGPSKERWPVRVPAGTGERASKALASVRGSGAGSGLSPYTVRFGDTLENIAASRGMTPERLADLNGMLLSEGVAPGTVLLVASGATEPLAPQTSEESAVVVPAQAYTVPGRKRVFYRVLRGDTLAAIANALEVTPDELVIWNELDPRAKLQAGMSLQAFVAPNTDLARVRTLPSGARTMQVGSLEFLHHFEALAGRKRILVRAKHGDTLEKIGKRHGLSVGMMERINRCPRTRVLTPGDEVVVYAKSESGPGALISERPTPNPDAVLAAGASTGSVLASRPVSSAAPPRPELLPAATGRAQD